MGWRQRRVIGMILGEALILSAAGAVVGVTAAVLVVWWLSTLPITSGFVQGDLPPVVLLYGLLTAFLVAVVGGVWPAWRAARCLPSEALRHE